MQKGICMLGGPASKVCEIGSQVSRVNVWIAGHTRKNGAPIDKAAKLATERMREAFVPSAETSSSSLLNVVLQTLSPKRLGRERGCELGVTSSSLKIVHHKSQRKMHLEEQLKNLTNVVEAMRVQMESRWSQRPGPHMDMPTGSTSVYHEPNISVNERCLLLNWDGKC